MLNEAVRRGAAEFDAAVRQAMLLHRLVQALCAGLVDGRREVIDLVAGGSELPRQDGDDENCREKGPCHARAVRFELLYYNTPNRTGFQEKAVSRRQIISPFPKPRHAHDRCLERALSRAEEACAERGLRLTELRRRVLELVWSSHEPVKAYDILSVLRQERRGAAPPTVYRALEFLTCQGFVHRIPSLNAYVGCGDPGHEGGVQLLICSDCGDVAEVDDPEVASLLARCAQQLGFRVHSRIVELSGQCAGCRTDR